MLYDNVRYLGHMLHMFLNDNPNLLYDLYGKLSRSVVSTPDVTTLLIDRFDEWLENYDCRVDIANRKILQGIVEAFVKLVSTGEVVRPLAYA